MTDALTVDAIIWGGVIILVIANIAMWRQCVEHAADQKLLEPRHERPRRSLLE